MKSILLFLFVAFFFSRSLPAQADFRTVYHPQINQAELAIVDEDYHLALQHYNRAFESIPTGFARDYHNASLCAIAIGEWKSALDFMRALVAKGVEKSFFEKNADWYVELQGQGWGAFINQYEETRKMSFGKTVDYQFIGRLGELENRDQAFRYSYELYRDTIKKIDQENIEEFLRLVEQKGFPTEEMLGVKEPTSIRGRYYLIIWHHLKNWKSDTTLSDIRPVLLDALKNGKLPPEAVAEFLNVSESKAGALGPYGNTAAIVFNSSGTYNLRDFNESELERVNANREQLGLCTEADYGRKARYHYHLHNRRSKFKVVQIGEVDVYPEMIKDRVNLKLLN